MTYAQQMETHASYSRLIAKLLEASGTTLPAEAARWLTREGYLLSPQTLHNWKTRGVPEVACLHISRIIGCNPIWVFFGDAAYETHSDQSPRLRLVSQNTYNLTPDEIILVQGFRDASEDMREVMLATASLATEKKKNFAERNEKT